MQFIVISILYGYLQVVMDYNRDRLGCTYINRGGPVVIKAYNTKISTRPIVNFAGDSNYESCKEDNLKMSSL